MVLPASQKGTGKSHHLFAAILRAVDKDIIENTDRILSKTTTGYQIPEFGQEV
jgi:hypothetical protein